MPNESLESYHSHYVSSTPFAARTRRFVRRSRFFSVSFCVLGVAAAFALFTRQVPCFLSFSLIGLLMTALGLLAITFQVLSTRGIPLRAGRVAWRVFFVLGTLAFGQSTVAQMLENIHRGRALGYDLFPGSMVDKPGSCFETQLFFGFQLAEEEKYGFSFSRFNYIAEVETEQGAHRLLDAFRRAQRYFGSQEVVQASEGTSEAVFDSVISLAVPEAADSINSADEKKASRMLLARLRAWEHWRVSNLHQYSLDLLKDYFHSIQADSLRPNLLLYREAGDWVLDLRALGPVDDLPEDFAWFPVQRVLLAEGALKAANDAVTSQWSSKVLNWGGPNATQVALRRMLQDLYKKPPFAQDVAELENDNVAEIHLSQPVSDTSSDSTRYVELNLEDLNSLQELNITGTGIAKNAGLVLMGPESPLKVLRIRNERINAIEFVGLTSLLDVDVSNLGLSHLAMDGNAFKGRIRLAGNRLCSPRMQEKLQQLSNVEGLDQQDCAGRPRQWDSLLASVYAMEDAGDAITISNNLGIDSLEYPRETMLWSEARNIDWDYFGATLYTKFYPNAVVDNGNILYAGKFQPLLGGKLKVGMTLAQVENVLGTPLYLTEDHATWRTGDACDEPYGGLKIGFDDHEVIHWVMFRGFYGECLPAGFGTDPKGELRGLVKNTH